MMTDQYKQVIDDLVNSRIEFDDLAHGSDPSLIEAMAASDYRAFRLIPGRLLTPELIDIGASDLCELMGEEDCFTQGSYESTVLKLLNKNINLLHAFHPDLLTKKIIDAHLEDSPWITIDRRKRIGALGASFIDAAALNKAVEARIDILSILDPSELELLTDQTLLASLSNKPSYGVYLEKIGRKDILIKAISEGLWLNNHTWDTLDLGNPLQGAPRPPTLRDAVETRMKMDATNQIDSLYYDCFVAGHSLEDLKPLVRSRARRAWIVELFPADEIRAVFRDDYEMKGMLLEQDLGM